MSINPATIKLRGARLLCDKVRPAGSGDDIKTEGGIIRPADSVRVRQSYGMRAHVLAVGPLVQEDIRPGCDIIMDEFGGRPIWDEGRELPYWLVGESEVMVVLDETP